MEFIKTGFLQVDEALDGLKRGKIYFISALDRDASRGFAASLCASVDYLGFHQAIFITDSPIPYCRCEHIHFADIEELIEFFRVILDGDKTYGLSKTDLYVFDDFDLFFMQSCSHWPRDTFLRKHLYEVYLYTIKSLAEEFQVTVMLMDQLDEDNSESNSLCFDFPDMRHKLSDGSFKLCAIENDILTAQYINHCNLDNISLRFAFAPKEITQVYPAYVE